MKGDDLNNLNLAFEVAERDLDIPKMLDAEGGFALLPMDQLGGVWFGFACLGGREVGGEWHGQSKQNLCHYGFSLCMQIFHL